MKYRAHQRILSIALLLAGLYTFAGDSGVDNRGSGTEQWWDKLPRAEWSQFERLDEAKIYPVVTNSFLVGGGDKFDILVEKTISREIGG